MNVALIVGTRPNFIKITRFPEEFRRSGKVQGKIIHTGQHYDERMSTVFFEQFGLTPDIFLGIERGSPNTQMASIMQELEKVFLEISPDMVLVVGDVNSTAAAALTANKMNLRIGHIESGLRSFDRTMPEEFNRIIADQLSDYCFVTEQSGLDNLSREGKPSGSVFFVGNTMIDTLVAFQPQIDKAEILKELCLEAGNYCLMTMHRPSNVDGLEGLQRLLNLIGELSPKIKIVFPIHPRTVKFMKDHGLYQKLTSNKQLILTEPMDYFGFQKLLKNARFILTDSGGVQEESTFLGIPCLTLRPNTERPSTVIIGTNELLPFDLTLISEKVDAVISGRWKKGSIPPLWDGMATRRIVEALEKI